MSSHVLPERSHVCLTSSYPELQKARARAVKLLNWAIFIYVITMYYVLCTIPTQPRTHARTHARIDSCPVTYFPPTWHACVSYLRGKFSKPWVWIWVLESGHGHGHGRVGTFRFLSGTVTQYGRYGVSIINSDVVIPTTNDKLCSRGLVLGWDGWISQTHFSLCKLA